MGDVKIELNREGVRKLLRDEPGVIADLERRGHNIATVAGPGHEVEAYRGETRTRVTVRTESNAAKAAEATTRNLTRAIEAGRV